jgi:hypothetical protein
VIEAFEQQRFFCPTLITQYYGSSMGNDYFWLVFPCWRRNLYFYWKKAFKKGVLAICKKKECFVEITFSPHPYDLKDLMLMRKLTIRYPLQEKSNGYMCKIFNDFSSDGTMRRGFFFL